MNLISDNKSNSGTRDTGVSPVNHGLKACFRRGTYLPHWEIEGGVYFVTFRLADSLPRYIVRSLKAQRKDVIKTIKKSDKTPTSVENKSINKLFSRKFDRYLDSGRGACHLKNPEIAEMVANALCHFDGNRYFLFAWSVMPNHVHVVVRPESGYNLSDILHSWKSFTAKRANKILKRGGRFWQPEYYDHLIRDEKDLKRCIEYTYYNPEKAGMDKWRWRGCISNINNGLG